MDTTLLFFLLASALKGALLLAVAGLAASRLPRSSAASRHLVWHMALLGTLALPVVSLVAPSWELLPSLGLERIIGSPPGDVIAPVLPAPAGQPADDGVPRVAVRKPGAEATVRPGSTTNAAAATSRPESGPVPGGSPLRGIPVGLALLVIWAAGAALVLGRFLLGTAVVRWFTWRARPVEAAAWASLNETMSFAVGLGHPVRLLKSARASTPMTFGVLNPVVLLPRDAEEWPEDRRRMVLLHELAHVQRLDSLTNVFATLACALYWFNPLVWLAVRRLRAEGERACDDWVLRAGMRASTYAEHLLDMVKTIGRLHTPAAALPMAQRSTFEGRLLAILEPGMNRNGTRRGQAVLLVTVSALLVLPLAALTAPASARAAGAAEELATGAGALPTGSALDLLTSPLAGKAARNPAAESDPSALSSQFEFEQEKAQEREPRLTPGALAALVGAVRDQDAEVRTASIRALGEAQDPRSIAALSAALRTDKDPQVRKAAAWALGNIEDAAGVPALLDALRGDSEIAVRRMAAWALGQIESETSVAGLSAAIRSEDRELRETVIWALGQIEASAAIPALAEALRDGDASIRERAAWALGQTGDDGAVAPLAAALKDSDPKVRHTAVWALGEIGADAAVDPLIGLLGDTDASVRQQATWALGEIGNERAVAGVSRLVGDASASVRETAVWALGEIGDAGAAGALASALRDAQPEVRGSAAWALGEIGERPAPPALIEALRDDNVEVRRTAVWALAEIEDPAAVAGLRGALKDADPSVRRSALRALAGVGDESALEALSELLKDPDPAVRKQAAAALGGRGDWPDPRPRPRPQPRPDPRPRPDGW